MREQPRLVLICFIVCLCLPACSSAGARRVKTYFEATYEVEIELQALHNELGATAALEFEARVAKRRAVGERARARADLLKAVEVPEETAVYHQYLVETFVTLEEWCELVTQSESTDANAKRQLTEEVARRNARFVQLIRLMLVEQERLSQKYHLTF